MRDNFGIGYATGLIFSTISISWIWLSDNSAMEFTLAAIFAIGVVVGVYEIGKYMGEKR